MARFRENEAATWLATTNPRAFNMGVEEINSSENKGSHMQAPATERLTLRRLHAGDAAFILRLVNEPSWLRYIGDKGVHTLEDAEKYIRTGPADMYARLGFGLWLVELKEGAQSIGICGLLKRDTLDDVDIGFAMLPEFWRQGYAFEAAQATVQYASRELRLPRLAAITSRDNVASCGLLEKLGFRLQQLVRLPPGDEEVNLFMLDLGDAQT